MNETNIILASNDSNEIYRKTNEANHFLNKLPRTLTFNNTTTVALREITFETSFPTFDGEYAYVCIPHEREIRHKNRVEHYSEMTGKNGSLLDFTCFTFHPSTGEVEFFFRIPLTNEDSFTNIFTKWEILTIFDGHHIIDLNGLQGKVSDDGKFVTFRQMSAAGIIPEIVLKYPNGARFEFATKVSATHTVVRFDFPKVKIETGIQLVKYLNKCLTDNVEFEFDELQHRLKVKKLIRGTEIHLKNGLEHILGFKETTLKVMDEMAYYRINLNRGIFALFVYIDIVQYSIVGQSMSRLLRIVHLPDTTFGKVHCHSPSTPIYLPLAKTSFDTVEVKICDAYGRLIPFQGSKVILTLSFQHKQTI